MGGPLPAAAVDAAGLQGCSIHCGCGAGKASVSGGPVSTPARAPHVRGGAWAASHLRVSPQTMPGSRVPARSSLLLSIRARPPGPAALAYLSSRAALPFYIHPTNTTTSVAQPPNWRRWTLTWRRWCAPPARSGWRSRATRARLPVQLPQGVAAHAPPPAAAPARRRPCRPRHLPAFQHSPLWVCPAES